jgi:hypothetical protein
MAPQQLAPPVTAVKSVSPAHLMRHTAVFAQLTEQPPVQVTSQAEPSLQEMLPLAPRVTAHEASAPQSMLHDSPHVPLHLASLPHASVQLPPQFCVVKSHEVAASQLQLVPVQAGGVVVETPPQLVAKATRTITSPSWMSEVLVMIVRYRDLNESGRWFPRPRRRPLAPPCP